MTDPVKRTDVVAETLASMITAYRGRPNIEAIVTSHALQLQEIENVFFQILLLTTLDGSTGAQLDGIGTIVNELRKGRDDTDYAAALRSRIAINRSSPTINQMLAVLVSVQDRMYLVQELGHAAIAITAGDAYTSTDPSVQTMYDILQQIKAGGVEAKFIYKLSNDSNVFKTASGDVAESNANQGAGNDSGTTGGKLADVYGD